MLLLFNRLDNGVELRVIHNLLGQSSMMTTKIDSRRLNSLREHASAGLKHSAPDRRLGGWRYAELSAGPNRNEMKIDGGKSDRRACVITMHSAAITQRLGFNPWAQATGILTPSSQLNS
jgi:hypothetical protein